jgi:hypothetical protein
MVQRGQHFGLALELSEAVGILRDRFRQDLVATARFRLVSVARYTSPMPPSPRAEDFMGSQRAPGAAARAYAADGELEIK